MTRTTSLDRVKLSVVVPCFNEEKTLARCVDRVLAIADGELSVEVVIVDDCSTDGSLRIAHELAGRLPNITVLHHDVNRGKGAALRTGFQKATGNFVAVQDADLEYDPVDLGRLLDPLRRGEADVVLGSRFLSPGPHRVLYFWHSVANRVLTTISNMFTDLNMTDMETCYKVFRRDVIQSIDPEEDRFGFEPEIVAKIAQRRLRVFEIGISYAGRTYEEGKKIGLKDAMRALYCVVRYNAHSAPIPLQFLVYILIGGAAGAVNLATFVILYSGGLGITTSAVSAFVIAALVNYLLCVAILFRRGARWRPGSEVAIYGGLIAGVAVVDATATSVLIGAGLAPTVAKAVAALGGLVVNFAIRRFVVFAEPGRGPWAPQEVRRR